MELGPGAHAALAAVFTVHAAVFGYLGAVRRRQVRQILLALGFALLAVAHVGWLGGATPGWAPPVAWAGRALFVVALTMLLANRFASRRAR